MTTLWQRLARLVTGPYRGCEWKSRYRKFGPIPRAVDDPEFICFAVERGLVPWREKYQPRYF